MIKTETRGSINLGLERQWVDITCLCCKLEESVQLGDLLDEKKFLCRGCKNLIVPLDEFGEASTQIKRLKKQFKNMFKGFR